MNDFFLSATLPELSEALSSKKIRSVDLTRFFLERIHRFNAVLNCYITVCEPQVLEAAQLADECREKGDLRPFLGIPIAHKDIFCALNTLTTCGSRMLEHFMSPYDASIVHHCRQAGFILLGKCNMDEFAMGSSNENSYFGNVHNPWNLDYVPGGSSGGSAAAVAARLTTIATGSDTGGSIRLPASFCGITGLKPTYGRVSRFGMVAFSSSLEQAGPLAKTAEDCAVLLSIMGQPDQYDATCVQKPFVPYQHFLSHNQPSPDKPLAGIRLGLPKQFFSHNHSVVNQAVEDALAVLQKLGACCVDLDLPRIEVERTVALYQILSSVEAFSNLARFDGVRYGYRAEPMDHLEALYCNTRSTGFGPEVKRRLLMGAHILHAKECATLYEQAQRIRRMVANDFQEAFTKCHAIIGPTHPSTAFGFGSGTTVQMHLHDLYTIPANLGGFPSVSAPCGFDEKNLPIGFQITGPHFTEDRLLTVVHIFQQNTHYHRSTPPLDRISPIE